MVFRMKCVKAPLDESVDSPSRGLTMAHGITNLVAEAEQCSRSWSKYYTDWKVGNPMTNSRAQRVMETGFIEL